MMKTRAILFMPLMVLSACATQKDMNYVEGQVSQLKQESQVIKQQSAGSYSEITQYREEVASLSGAVNELQHDHRGAMKRLDMEDSLMVSKTNDLENRIARIESYLGLETPGAGKTPAGLKVLPPPAASAKMPAPEIVADQKKGQTPVTAQTSAPPVALAAEDALINEGLVRMKKEDYAGARESFNAFKTGKPKSPKVADAQFYVAESYFGEKWYEKAILEYQVVIARYTKSAKRPAALYKQGLSFSKIGDEANAKARYKDVVNLYPNSPEAKLAKKSLGMK
jgi:tol-pal system protein YbgF